MSEQAALESARLARDPRFDGRFFIGVLTTGIYCRPICPVKMPKSQNVQFFRSAAQAGEAGFRPCLRCRPEAAPGTPAWLGTSTTVTRALRLIGEGELDRGSVESLAARLGITSRYLSQLFSEQLGAPPVAIAQTRRLHNAKRLLDETNISITDVAFAAGYGSVRRLNDHFQKTYGRTPGSLRREPGRTFSESGSFSLQLHYRPPYDFAGILNFLRIRATPGVETVTADAYKRTFIESGTQGAVCIRQTPGKNALSCVIETESPNVIMQVVNKVRRLFDLDADPTDINAALSADSVLAEIVHTNPGQRIAGCWDPFEIAVRAIVGQQVSVKGATTVMGEIVKRYGEQRAELMLFPTPRQLSELDPATLPMPGKRALAIQSMAAAVASGQVDFAADPEDVDQSLQHIKGIGPWTAQYVAMRALSDPDAFLSNDLILLRTALQLFSLKDEKALLARAENWRPWRAYAGSHIWRASATLGAPLPDGDKTPSPIKKAPRKK